MSETKPFKLVVPSEVDKQIYNICKEVFLKDLLTRFGNDQDRLFDLTLMDCTAMTYDVYLGKEYINAFYRIANEVAGFEDAVFARRGDCTVYNEGGCKIYDKIDQQLEKVIEDNCFQCGVTDVTVQDRHLHYTVYVDVKQVQLQHIAKKLNEKGIKCYLDGRLVDIPFDPSDDSADASGYVLGISEQGKFVVGINFNDGRQYNKADETINPLWIPNPERFLYMNDIVRALAPYVNKKIKESDRND